MRFNWDFLDVVKHRKTFFILSIVLTLAGILSLFVLGLNRGVDFKAGTTIDLSTAGQAIEQSKAVELLEQAGVPAAQPPVVGGDLRDRVTLRFDTVLSPEEVRKVESGFVAAYGDQVSLEENTVDTELAEEMARKAVIAVLVASLFIIIYVTIRFEWRFAIAGVVALLHDAFIVITLFSIFQLEVTLTFVAAVLTIVGYSINDTIVIFDRIRENQRFAKIKTFDDLGVLVNNSVRQTMTRSINTMITVLIAAVCLYIMGSPSIRLFSLAMVIGLLSGVYSSICIASPLWLVLKKSTIGKPKKTAPAQSNI